MESVVYSEGGLPQLELAADELVFAVPWKQFVGSKAPRFHMTRLDPDEERQLLTASVQKERETAPGKVEIMLGMGLDLCCSIAARHYVALKNVAIDVAGTEPDPEEARRFFDLNAQILAPRIVHAGYFGGYVAEEEEPEDDSEEDAGGLLVIAPDAGHDNEVEILWPLWSATKNREETVRIVYRVGETDERARVKYRKALRREIDKRRKTECWTFDYARIEDLAENLIEEIVSGALINGQPCRQENRKQWLSRVPLDHKFRVMAAHFGRIQVKN